MNRIYRVVRNATTGAWVVASELASSHGRTKRSAVKGSTTLALITALSFPAFAAAENIDRDVVVSGLGNGDQPSPWEVDSIQVGTEAGSSGSLTVTDGGSVITNSGAISYANGSDGSLTVTGSGSTVEVGSTLAVGMNKNGLGTASISDQGSIHAYGMHIGVSDGATGVVNVSGPGSALTVDSSFSVGLSGQGTLNIENGGAVSAGQMQVGAYAKSEGTVNVTGPGSTLDSTRFLQVGTGADSKGALNILDGGVVTSLEVSIGSSATNTGTSNGAQGSVMVDGAGSKLETQTLQVGGSGTGQLTISNGGLVNGSFTSISAAGSEGSVIHVTGDRSALQTTSLTVGDYADDRPTSLLLVDNGAQVISGENTTIQARGAVKISDAESMLVSSRGLQNNGILMITDGGALQSSAAVVNAADPSYIGTGSLSLGEETPLAMVTGAGSTWYAGEGDLYVADGTLGDLVIADGGRVMVSADATSHVGHAHEKYGDAAGRVAVTGVNSTWNSGHLEIGQGAQDMFDSSVTHAGYGTLTITDGGKAASTSAALGTGSAGSQGNIVVSGAGSMLDNGGAMQVGVAGEGSITVADGGRVRSVGDVILAQEVGSTGTLNIGMGGAAGTLEAAQVVGSDGTAKINFDHTDSTDFDAAMRGTMTVAKRNTGTTRLLAVNDYIGATTVEGGTLQAGVTGALSANSAFTVAPTATLAMAGFNQTISSLDNAGTVAFSDSVGPGARRAPVAGTTLTVTGDYAGNGGALAMNTVLGGDNSVTDKLVVDGSTSGETFVQIKNAGGAGAATDNGIELISVAGASNGNFTLQGRAVAGLYDYQLYKGGTTTPDDGNWYLRSEAPPVTPEVPGTPEIPGSPGNPGAPNKPNKPGKPTLRPEPGAYLGNQNAALRMFDHTMHDRVGEPGLTARQDSVDGYATWMRVKTGKLDSGKIDGQVDVDTNTTVMQLGVEKQFDVGTGRLHAGVMGGYGHATTDAKSNVTDHKTRGVVDGKNLGIYGTWFENPKSPEGAYVDTWLQYGDFDNTVKGDHLGSEKYRSRTWSGSLEAGYSIKVHQGESYGVYLEPQAQVIHTHYRSDDVREENGTHVQSGKAGGTTTRLGARVYARSLNHSTNRIQPFAEVNWWSGGNKSSIAMDGERISHDLPKNILETKAGAQFEIGGGWSGYGSVGYQLGSSSFSDVSGQVGVKFSF